MRKANKATFTSRRYRELMQNNRFECYKHLDTKPSAEVTISPHHHAFYEIIFVVDGHFFYEVEGRPYHLSKGDVILIDELQFHHGYINQDQSYERFALWIHPKYMQLLAKRFPKLDPQYCFLQLGSHNNNVIHLDDKTFNELKIELELLFESFWSKTPSDEVLSESYFAIVITKLNQIVHRQEQAAAATAASLSATASGAAIFSTQTDHPNVTSNPAAEAGVTNTLATANRPLNVFATSGGLTSNMYTSNSEGLSNLTRADTGIWKSHGATEDTTVVLENDVLSVTSERTALAAQQAAEEEEETEIASESRSSGDDNGIPPLRPVQTLEEAVAHANGGRISQPTLAASISRSSTSFGYGYELYHGYENDENDPLNFLGTTLEVARSQDYVPVSNALNPFGTQTLSPTGTALAEEQDAAAAYAAEDHGYRTKGLERFDNDSAATAAAVAAEAMAEAEDAHAAAEAAADLQLAAEGEIDGLSLQVSGLAANAFALAAQDDGSKPAPIVTQEAEMKGMSYQLDDEADFQVNLKLSERLKLSALLKYINLNINESLSLDELAQRFNLSKFYLTRRFKELTGLSLHQFIVKKRLTKARYLISIGIDPYRAAVDAGFNNYSHFSRTFKSYFGQNPSSIPQANTIHQNDGATEIKVPKAEYDKDGPTNLI